jgi:hypothetical protein
MTDKSSKAACALLLGVMVSSPGGAESVKNGFQILDPLVPEESILHGGPQRDGIPAILEPRFVMPADAHFLDRDDRVLGLSLNGVSRAYPIKIMNYHEVVNDDVGGDPVVISFCPLCGTGIAFHRSIDGEARTFGVSGLLYNSDVLMYDHQTESLWSQIAAMAISGESKGARLQRIALLHTSWGYWRQRHPRTQVLSIATGYNRNYYRDPYAGYASSDRTFLPVAHSDDRLSAKEVVLGLEVDGRFKAYPFSELPSDENTIEDQHAGRELLIEYDLRSMSARVIDSAGVEIPTFTAFWFAWAAFHPDTDVFSR